MLRPARRSKKLRGLTLALLSGVVAACLSGCTDSGPTVKGTPQRGADIAAAYDAVVVDAPSPGATLGDPVFLAANGAVTSTCWPCLSSSADAAGVMWWHEGAMTSIDNATLTGTTASGAALGITQVGARDVVFTLDGSGLTSFPLPAGAQGLTAGEAGGTVYAAVTQQNTAAAGDTTAAMLALRAEAWAQMFSVPRPWPAVLLKDVRADGAMLLHYSDARGQVLDVFRHATGALDTLASPGTGFKCWPTDLLSSSRVLGTCQDMAFASTGIGVYAWDPPDYTPRLLDPHAGAWFLGGANDAGLVIGTLNVAPGQGGPGTVPVAWTAVRGLVDLRPLIRGGAPWVPTEGRAVNANGQILVRASKSTGVTAYLLLTPRP